MNKLVDSTTTIVSVLLLDLSLNWFYMHRNLMDNSDMHATEEIRNRVGDLDADTAGKKLRTMRENRVSRRRYNHKLKELYG